MIAPIITQLRLDTNVNAVLGPALLDMIITRHKQSLNREDLIFTWLDAFRSLILLFQDAHVNRKPTSRMLWDSLVEECFEKLCREEECPTDTI